MKTGARLSRRRFIGASATALAGLAAFGCAPAATPTAERPVPGGAPAGVLADRSAQATVNFGTIVPSRGVTEVNGLMGQGIPELRGICHSALSVYDHDYNVVPMLAERLPSVDDGSWVVNSDGTMQVTWRLRPGVTWHDGRPFTSRDLRFSWEFSNDSSLPLTRRPIHSNVTAIDLPNDHTAVMHWKVANNFAHVITAIDMFIYPEHIVRPLWESGEGERIFADDFFQHGFVGLGPYRIERWNEDGSIVFKPFDNFFLGRPKIGTIVMHQLESSLAVLTRLLAGELHMAGGLALRFDEGLAAQEHWEAKGQGKVHWTPISLSRLVLPPSNALFRDARVRKALLMAIDRDELNQTFFNGTAIVAHSLLHPNEPGFKAADAAIMKYQFDPRGALGLLEQVGWQRMSDGILANAAGERFDIPYRASQVNQEALRVQGAVANYWKEIGVRVTFDNVSDQVFRNNQEHATFLGVTQQGGGTSIGTMFRRWHSTYIPTADNRYLGDNIAFWNNPEADRLLEQLDRSFTQPAMEETLVRLARVFGDDLPTLPLYYSPEPIPIHRSLKNARPRPNSSGQHSTSWSCYQWEWA